MYSFKNDYSEWAHPNILAKLSETNLIQEEWYWEDCYCKEASKLICKEIWNSNADIHFVSWWTQANLIVISSILKPHQSVIAVDSWHIAVHEAWAIESSWHKINTVKWEDWKITVDSIQSVLDSHEDEHMVQPKLVFISHSTEIGSIYSHKQLKEISDFCRKNNLYLYLDGARIASALTSHKSDMSLSQLSRLVDIFYIWWTKNGALLWEAIVVNNELLKEDFRFFIKQKWALLAKWRVLWIQFLELFKNNLFFELWKHANNMANKIANAIEQRWYSFLVEPESNQIFPILPNKLIDTLNKKYWFYVWKKMDTHHSAIRLVTSWATQEKFVDQFIDDLNQ